tara:strand:- start:1145 stop:1495 length:351 start_codon:yes stop_codon:yes gene_type:complete
MGLTTTFASRSASQFVLELQKECKVPQPDLERATRLALEAHVESHLALEFLSELALRASVLRHISAMIGEAEYGALHDALCTINVATQSRLVRALGRVGLPAFYWEDVVLRMLTST